MYRSIPLLALTLAGLPSPVAARPAGPTACPWQTAWASAQMVPAGENALPAGALVRTTLRQIVRPSIGGTAVRIRVSNAFGTEPLRIAAASLARPVRNSGPDLVPGSVRALRFSGQTSVVIPPGADWLSDPVSEPLAAFADLAVSLYLTDEPKGQTAHPGSRATSYLIPGDATAAASVAGATPVDRWYMLAGVEVSTCRARPGIVVLGDSITDGRGSTTNGNDRWTDLLARRLDGRMAVINQGIGGNRVLLDGLGPNALARLDRDVLAQPGVAHLIVLEGINDIGNLSRNPAATAQDHRDLVAQLTGAYAQIVARARARGIKVHGATLLPFMGNTFYHPDAAAEADRQAVNNWIRTSGMFDSVTDFDRVMRDPARPGFLLPRYDVGDGLHPNPAGFRAMAEAVRLALFRR